MTPQEAARAARASDRTGTRAEVSTLRTKVQVRVSADGTVWLMVSRDGGSVFEWAYEVPE